MKFRVVNASHAGPVFFEFSDWQMLAIWLLRCGRQGCLDKSESLWKSVRGKWKPVAEWDMKAAV